MTISQAIIALTACLEQFGDAECKFVQSDEGNPAIELHPALLPAKCWVDSASASHEAAARFNARFPTKKIFIPGRN